MNREIKEYADTLYMDALIESSETVRKDRVVQAQKSAALGPTRLPTSGADIQNRARMYEVHVERCMDARLRSYQLAYAETAEPPSEEDFGRILDDCKAVWETETNKCTKALKEFVGSHSPIAGPVIDKMLENCSGAGHDRVYRKFKIWKAKLQLRPLWLTGQSRRRSATCFRFTARLSLSETCPLLD